MIQGIYVTEINELGIVTKVEGALMDIYSTLLPKLGDNLFALHQSEISNFFKQNRENIFNSTVPHSYLHTINRLQFQLSVYNHSKESTIICWQGLPQSTDSRSIKNNKNKAAVKELHRNLSLDFIDSLSLPIFELAILPDENFRFVYANDEMVSLFPNLTMKDYESDIRIIFSNLNYFDKEQLINSITHIDSSKTWTFDFRLYVNKKTRWFRGYGNFSQYGKSDSYKLSAYLRDITEKKQIFINSMLFESSFRKSETPIYYVKEDASFFDFNDAANQTLGYTRKELMAMKVHDFDPNYQLGEWKIFWNLMKRKRFFNLDTSHQKKNGTIFNVHVVCNMIEYEQEKFVCSYIFDLTERQKLENEIKLADFSFNNLHTAIHIIGKDCSVFKSNEAAQTLLGYTEEEYQQLKIPDFDPSYNESAWVQRWEVIKKEGRKTFNTLLKKQNGTIIPVEVVTNFLLFEGKEYTFAFFSDISQRVAEEERLRLLESVVVHSNDAILIAEANPSLYPGPKVIFANDAFTKITGYTSEEIVGQTPRLLQNSNTDRKELDRMKEAITNWLPCEITVINVKKSGEEFWNNIHIVPIADDKGWFTHWISIQRDVTNRINVEIEREQFLKEMVVKNNKLRQFSYIATHNLRAPLTNLLSASRMMKTETISDPLNKTLIDIFKKSTQDLNETLNTLMNALLIHDNEKVKIEKLSLQNMLKSVCSKNSLAIADSCCLIKANFSAVREVNFNAEYLDSIFQNLITNSIKYAHPSRQPEITIRSKLLKDKTVQITFSDNGLGMDMQLIKDRIFGLNQRFHDHVDSNGIGLYLVHTQLTALGGSISVASEVNVGTKFFVNFK